MDAFLKRCFYHSGQYSSEEHFLELDNKLKGKEVLMHALEKLIYLRFYLQRFLANCNNIYIYIVASILIMVFEALVATMYQLLKLKTIRL